MHPSSLLSARVPHCPVQPRQSPSSCTKPTVFRVGRGGSKEHAPWGACARVPSGAWLCPWPDLRPVPGLPEPQFHRGLDGVSSTYFRGYAGRSCSTCWPAEQKVQEGLEAAGRPATSRGRTYWVLTVGCQALSQSCMDII